MVGELGNQSLVSTTATEAGYAIYPTDNGASAGAANVSSTNVGNAYGTTYRRTPYAIHFNGENWLYTDGHVKWMVVGQESQSVNGVGDWLWLAQKP